MNASNTQVANGKTGTNGREPFGSVLVCGGGIAGIQASLDLSAAGFRVYLVEESPTIGGGMARLDKTFPTNDCATCIISPKLVECMRDLNIEVMTMSDVIKLDGEAGRFQATVRQRPRSVDPNKCTGCGDCWSACPVRNCPESTPEYQPSEHIEEVDLTNLREILVRYGTEPDALMPILQGISDRYGYLPRSALEHVSVRLGISLAAILRVASFYHEFRLDPPARHIVQVCSGTSCYSRGTRALLNRLESEIGIRVGETDKDKRFTLQTVRCLGLCALSPAIKIDGISFGRVNLDNIPEILEQFA